MLVIRVGLEPGHLYVLGPLRCPYKAHGGSTGRGHGIVEQIQMSMVNVMMRIMMMMILRVIMTMIVDHGY